MAPISHSLPKTIKKFDVLQYSLTNHPLYQDANESLQHMKRAAHKYPVFANRLHFARAFRSHSFTLLWVGQTISLLGDAVFNIAITWEVLLLTGSATAMSLIIISQWAPTLVFHF